MVVGLREATLILSDPKTEMALAQWSLPALVRLTSGAVPALFGPGDDGSETVENDVPELISALENVRGALERRRPHKGRLRGANLAGSLLTATVRAVCWPVSYTHLGVYKRQVVVKGSK